MSSPILICLLIVFGFVLGSLSTLLILRSRLKAEREAGRMESEAQLQPKISALDVLAETRREEIEQRGEKIRLLEVEREKLFGQISESKTEISRLETNLQNEKSNAERRQNDEETLSNRFASLSKDALKENSREFIGLANDKFKDKLDPVANTMTELKGKVEQLSVDKDRLADEAKNLSNALRRADIRGRWGELQLKRVVELAGMLDRCDFFLQQSFEDRRPDMVVNLPFERYVVVDSKTVMDAYLSACEATDSAANADYLAKHAKQVRDKIDDLAKIDYPRVLEKNEKNVADMVVCYIPGEAFFSAAVAQDPTLLEYAAKRRVFLASPTSLITLLRAIALGWRDHELSDNAEEICRLGKELYARLSGMKSHFDKLGDGVQKSVDAYNSMVSSLNRMVFPQARRFRDLGATEVGAKDIAESCFIEETVRKAESADWNGSLSIAAGTEE